MSKWINLCLYQSLLILFQGGMVSHPGNSTNPFDIAFESDVDTNNMVSLFLWFTIVLIITLASNSVPYTFIYELHIIWCDGSICGPTKYMFVWIGAQNERKLYERTNCINQLTKLQIDTVIITIYKPEFLTALYTSPPKSNSKH